MKGAIVLYHDKEKGREGDSNNDNSWGKKRNLKARGGGGVNSLYQIKVVMAVINGYYYMHEGIYDEICECLSTP